jgi:lipid A ethanolaminephosphotransferase
MRLRHTANYADANQNLMLVKPKEPLWLVLFASVWTASVGNFALWLALYKLPDVSGMRGLGLCLGVALMLGAILFAMQALFASAHTSKWLAVLLLLLTAPASYFMATYGVVIDPAMMNNTAQTHVAEVLDLLSGRLLLVLLLVLVVPALVLWRLPLQAVPLGLRLRRNAAAAVAALLVAALALYAVYADLAPLMRNHKGLRYMATPLNVIYGSARMVVGSKANKPLVVDDVSPRLMHGQLAAGQLPVLVLVVGETARADRFGLNGYARQTTPKLQARDVLNFTDVSSCGTNTADSVPCMFSHLGRAKFFSADAPHQNLLDLLQDAGYAVQWVENNSGCKGVCARVPTEDLSQAQHPQHCNSEGCFDEILTYNLAQRIQNLALAKPDAKGLVIVLHQLGSHGPAYYKRSPPTHKRFMPECQTNILQNCSAEEVGNAFDNSILYTDTVLDSALDQLQKLPRQFAPGLLYVSDHGESLGEGGVYLHSLPYAIAPQAQKKVPMLMWLGTDLLSWRGLNSNCLRQHLNKPYSHDNLYHTVLELLDVTSTTYIEDLDILEPCEQAAMHIPPKKPGG